MSVGKMSPDDIRKLLNKTAGQQISHNLNEENPTNVTEWIPTGSRWLDSIICRGKLAGIPVGKVTEIAGLESTGKSYMAAQVAANAQKMGIQVVYFDSESALDSTFLKKSGCNVDDIVYTQAVSVEKVLEMIEMLMINNEQKMLFIWDSLALTPTEKTIEGDFNPQSSMAVKARVLSKGMQKLTVPIANTQSTMLVLNQLKTNITNNIAETLTTPYVTPGGKTLPYTYSLRVWLTSRKAKNAFVTDEKGYRIGSEVKCTLKKSRFGTQGRQCTFKILWGENIGVQDEESWFEAVKGAEQIESKGAWYSLTYADGTSEKFQAAKWMDKLKDEKFKNRILEIMDEEVIMKFHTREGNASDFYEIDEE
jgi:recombination protein RecA